MKPNARFATFSPPALALVATLVLVAVASMPAAGRPSTPGAAAHRSMMPWKAVAASGPVEALYAPEGDRDWQRVHRGDELRPQTHVKTGSRGRVTLSRNASLIIVDPQSRVELPDRGGETETSVIQSNGSVLYKVDGRSNPHFEVVTPYLVAGVKGTTFLVTVTTRYTSVTVGHGSVEVVNPVTGETRLIEEGESIIQRSEESMEVVDDLRRTRETRREAKKLARMDRPLDSAIGGTDESAIDALSTDALVDGRPWSDETADKDLLDPASAELFLEDEMQKELVEEMIREGVNDGTFYKGLVDGLFFEPLLVTPDPVSGATSSGRRSAQD